jgi:putative NADH-flavin reductase
MKIALVGATGFIGKYILDEAITRGHQVTALVRHTDKVPASDQVTAQMVDLNNSAALTDALAGHDVAILSFRHMFIDLKALIAAVKASSVARLIVVGGAGSLYVAPGIQLIDTPEFPDSWRPLASAAAEFLQELRKEEELNWAYISPSALIESGKRTGVFRMGKDDLLIDDNGESRISTQDFALAILDETENPSHIRTRFTVGY